MAPLASIPAPVRAALTAVRRRRRLLSVLQAGAWTASGLLLLAVVATLRGVDPAPDWQRWAAWLWMVGWTGVPIVLFVLPAWKRTGSALALARAVDDRVPETQDSLLTAVDLAGALRSGRFDGDPEADRLARAHLDRAAELAARVDAGRLLPLGLLGSALRLGPAALLALLALQWFAPERLHGGLRALLQPPAEVEAAPAEPGAEPVTLVLRNIDLRLEPPAYSGREPLELAGTTGDFQALPGTKVRFEADGPPGGRGVELEWEAEPAAPGAAVELDGERLKADFVVPGSGRYRLRVKRGLAGKTLQSRWFRVDALPDDPPDLEVLGGPAEGEELAPESSVVLEVQAADDFGLTRLERVVYMGRKEIAREAVTDAAGRASASGTVRWTPVAELEGRGGEVRLVIEAWDNDTVNGPKVTRSRPLELYVPTKRDQHRRVLELQEKLLAASLDLLAPLLTDSADREEAMALGRTITRADLLGEHDDHAARARELFAVGRTLTEAMAQDELGQARVAAGVVGVLENILRAWTGLDDYVHDELRLGKKDPFVHPGHVVELLDRREGLTAELERAVLDLADFADLDRAGDIAAGLSELDSGFTELADLMRQAAEGKPIDAQMEAALQDLERQLAELAEAMGQRRGGPDDGFANRMPAELGKSTTDRIRELLKEGRIEEAMELLRQAQESAAGLAERLQGEMQGMAGSREMAQLQQAMQEAEAEALAIEREQLALQEESAELARKFGDGGGLDEDEAAALAARLDELARRVAMLPESAEDEVLRRRLRAWNRPAERASEEMAASFKEGSLDEAVAMGLQAESRLEDLAERLGSRSGDGEQPGSAEARAAARGAAREAGRLAEAVQALQGKAEAQRRRAGSAGEGARGRQDALAERTQALRRRLEELGGSAFNPLGARESLESAENLMMRAGSRLGQGMPRQAEGAQSDAVEQIQAFRRRLRQAREGMEQPGNSSSEMQAGAQRRGWEGFDEPDLGEVEMSDPEDFVTPDAFRRLVQEGAAEDAPERYRPLNGSYYEELVK